jgi:hypothetical protein
VEIDGESLPQPVALSALRFKPSLKDKKCSPVFCPALTPVRAGPNASIND